MKIKIKPKEATEIINSLIGGTVPRSGVQHIAALFRHNGQRLDSH